MVPYIIFAILVCFFYSKKRPKLILITMCVFAAIRYNVGWDYAHYIHIAEDSQALTIAMKDYGPIWATFFQAVNQSEIYTLAVIIPNILSYVFIYYALNNIFNHDKVRVSNSLMVYAFWPFYYLSSFSVVRQYLVISLALLFYSYLQQATKKNIIISILIFITCVFLHPSSIVIAFFFPLTLLKKNLKLWHILIFSLILIFAIYSMGSILSIINNSALSAYYEVYGNSESNFGGKLVYLLLFISLFLISQWKKLSCSRDKLMWTALVIIAMILESAISLFNLNYTISRIFLYYEVFLILVFHDSISYSRFGNLGKRVLNIFLVSLFFFFLITTNTKSSIQSASSAFVPYTFIWEK